jgi:hypothetical protein
MSRSIRITESASKLKVTCRLLDDKAPHSSGFLWQIASRRLSFDAIHAIWTGPELSCPMPANALPEDLAGLQIPLENATSYPKAGEIVLAFLSAGSIKGVPPGAFFDVGIFYDDGGRLLFPFGWLKANVCAEIVDSELPAVQTAMRTIRNHGACRIAFAPA